MTFTDLSNEISPFPDAGNVLMHDDHQQSSSFRPKKLLPIRSNTGGDSACSESSSPPESHPQPAAGDSMEIDGNPSSDSTFTKTLEQIGYDSDSYSKQKRKFIHELLIQFQASIGNNNEENPSKGLDPVDIHTTISPNFTSGADNGQRQEGEEKKNESCNQEEKNSTNKCSSPQLEEFLRNMVDEVLKKQEEMHRQFMDVIRKHDEDRIMREEAWRNQELQRQNREKEMRDQQNARNLALISFIENYVGHKILIPQIPLIQLNQPTQLIQTKQQPSEQTPLIQSNQRKRKHDQQEGRIESNTKRWPESEVKALISIRTAVDHKLRCREVKHNSVWEEISEAMSSLGYDRTANKCKEKWENINKYFKKTIAGGRRPKSTKTCPYFHELDILYRNGSLNPGTPLLITNRDTPLQITNGGEEDWNVEKQVYSTPEATPV